MPYIRTTSPTKNLANLARSVQRPSNVDEASDLPKQVSFRLEDSMAILSQIHAMLSANFEQVHAQHTQILMKLHSTDRLRLHENMSPRLHPSGKAKVKVISEETAIDGQRPFPSDLSRRSQLPQLPMDLTPSYTIISDVPKSFQSELSTRNSGLPSMDLSPTSYTEPPSPMPIKAKPSAKSGIMSVSSKRSMFSLAPNLAGLRDMEKLARIIQESQHLAFKRGSTANAVWHFLENGTSSRWAYFYGSYFAPVFLAAGVLISIIQTIEDWRMSEDIFSIIQTSFELWFALEITLRFIVCPDRYLFWFDLFNLIDFVSVTPLFFRICVWTLDADKDILVQVLALVPILRLLKILRRFHKFQLLLSAFSLALEALPILLFSLMLIALFFSGFIYLAESRALIPSLPHGLWFVMVTMTTVGYGDVVPETVPGKCLSAVLMILSALYMALPIGIVGNAFNEVWKDRDRLLLLAIVREHFKVCGVSRNLIREIFARLSESHNGEASEDGEDGEPEIDLPLFKKLLNAFQIEVSEARVLALFDAIDIDGGGTISCDEFIQRLFPNYLRLKEATSTSTVLSTKN